MRASVRVGRIDPRRRPQRSEGEADGRSGHGFDRHSHDMARRNYLAHTSLDGTTMTGRVRCAGYVRRGTWVIGENIAWGAGAVRAWMASPGHRATILSSRYREIGIGVAPGAPAPGVGDAATYTTDFGRRS